MHVSKIGVYRMCCSCWCTFVDFCISAVTITTVNITPGSSTSEAWHHHESSQSTTDRKEGHIQEMMKYIEDRGSPLSRDCHPVLHNFATKEVMTEDIRNDVLNAHESGKKKYEAFHNERIVNQTLKLGETIHRNNLRHWGDM